MSIIHKEKNEDGYILVHDEVIKKMAIEVLRECGGIYAVSSNFKRAFKFTETKKIAIDDVVSVSSSENRQKIDIRIAVKFGESINEKASLIIDNICKKINLALGIYPDSIRVNVVAVVAKRLAKRHVVIEKKYEI